MPDTPTKNPLLPHRLIWCRLQCGSGETREGHLRRFSDELIASVADKEVTLPLGIVVERRASIHALAGDIWIPVTVVTGARLDACWTPMVSGQGWDRFLAATLLLKLSHRETGKDDR